MNNSIIDFVRSSAVIKAAAPLAAVVLIFFPDVLLAAGHTLSKVTGGFWETYSPLEGLFICVMLAVFPRISMAYLSIVTGTFGITLLGLVGWFLVPHVLVACIATTLYWGSDPILVVLAWFIAFSGEIIEKTVIRRRF